ncbi:MAG: site-specific DNA-methyltransferase [Burkholderiales bacterium]|nr:site-specific DNA-methyltransferase [Phycisphaerae bacterium]
MIAHTRRTTILCMGKSGKKQIKSKSAATQVIPRARPSSLLDTRVVYCGDNLEQLAKLPDACIDLIYIDPPFNSNRNYEVFWGETKEKRSFDDRHASTAAYIDYMRPRCVQLARVSKKTGSLNVRPDKGMVAPAWRLNVECVTEHSHESKSSRLLSEEKTASRRQCWNRLE